jgi:ribosomal-protein-alanine N-acetyltransferase
VKIQLDSLNQEINTPRCLLRSLHEDDVSEQYVGWLNDPSSNQFLESRLIAQTKSTVSAFVQENFRSPSSILFGIFDRLNPSHVGNIRLSEVDQHHLTAEIGFIVGDVSFRGKGYASEAITAVTNWAFADLKLYKITAGCYRENIGSSGALAKAGFHLEATLRNQVISAEGHRQDILRFAKFPELV